MLGQLWFAAKIDSKSYQQSCYESKDVTGLVSYLRIYVYTSRQYNFANDFVGGIMLNGTHFYTV